MKPAGANNDAGGGEETDIERIKRVNIIFCCTSNAKTSKDIIIYNTNTVNDRMFLLLPAGDS